MLFLLSPAKTLDWDTPLLAHQEALLQGDPLVFQKQASQLVALLKKISSPELSDLMGISSALADLNVKRFKAWRTNPPSSAQRPAVLAFNGDVYEGLDAQSLSGTQLAWMQTHLVILSGLYGALRPMDLMQAYRLEMGTSLPNPQGKDLYAFWGEQVTQYLNLRLAQTPQAVVVNLASQEYFKVVKPKKLQAQVIDCVFEDAKNGQYKIIGFFAKRARGLMMRYCIEHKVKTPKALMDFDVEGYRFVKSLSTSNQFVYRREEQPPKARSLG